MSHRQARVGSVIQQELTALLTRGRLKDPRIHPMTTLSGVEVARDLSFARVFFTVPGDEPEEVEATRRGLEAARGFLQRHLARVMTIRTVPHLAFEYDASFAHGDRINRLLAGLPELQSGDQPDTAVEREGRGGVDEQGEREGQTHGEREGQTQGEREGQTQGEREGQTQGEREGQTQGEREGDGEP